MHHWRIARWNLVLTQNLSWSRLPHLPRSKPPGKPFSCASREFSPTRCLNWICVFTGRAWSRDAFEKQQLFLVSVRLAVLLPYFKSKYTRSCLIVGLLEAATKLNSRAWWLSLSPSPKSLEMIRMFREVLRLHIPARSRPCMITFCTVSGHNNKGRRSYLDRRGDAFTT